LSRPELSLFSYEILGLVGRQGVGAHDLLQMARQGRILDWAGESQYYVEPKRLAKLGYLDARKEPGRTRERTVYSLTDKGLDALRAWARTPLTFTPLKSEPLLRLLVSDLVGEAATRESVGTLREDIADLQARVDEGPAPSAEVADAGRKLPAPAARAAPRPHRRGRARVQRMTHLVAAALRARPEGAPGSRSWSRAAACAERSRAGWHWGSTSSGCRRRSTPPTAPRRGR